jgi:uncharacterized membrane protein
VPAAARRIPALDAARALGVVAMVCGHTLDALLAPAARALPAVAAYWQYRGLTAPLFLTVSGWAVATAIEASPARGRAIVAARAPRVLLLLGLGYALHWPAWAAHGILVGHRPTWRHLLAFDALHCIALALLAVAALFAASASRAARVAALAGLATALAAAAPLLPELRATGIPEIAWEQALRGTSSFPVVPWAAYFAAGAAIGVLARSAAPWALAAGAACAGAALVGAAHAAGLTGLAPWSPVLLVLRLGQVLLVLAALALVPPRLAAGAAPLGRASLFVYVLHVPVVYGWGTYAGLAQRLGPSLGVGAALAVALAVLAGCVAARALVHRALAAWRARDGGRGAAAQLTHQ